MHQARSASGCAEFRNLSRISRRTVLQAGALGAIGLTLPDLFAAQPTAATTQTSAGFGKAKRCIFLFMWGGPSHLDTFDLKPNAPGDIRGPFSPISTSAPGVQICEHFQGLSKWMHKVCLIRSLAHDDPAHLSSAHATLTGNLAPVIRSDAEPPSHRDSPHLGSVIAKLRPTSHLPTFVTVPWICSHPAAPGGKAPGQNAGWLGNRYSPFLINGDPSSPAWTIPELTLLDSVSRDRLEARRDLLRQVDAARVGLDLAGAMTETDALRQQLFDLLSSSSVRRAFDLSQEPEGVRDRYGRNIHGQCVLLARRLVEQGVPIVSVNWHNDGKTFWDTHGNNFNRLKDDLIPPADQALSALLTDLDERRLLDDTLVCWVGEFGRKPQITPGNAGREHWPGCYSGLLAGAGITGGSIFGASDPLGLAPSENPVTPLDYAATVYHALGIPPESTITNRLGRPIRVCEGRVIHRLWS
jgi:uncharacterized protein DUF1501